MKDLIKWLVVMSLLFLAFTNLVVGPRNSQALIAVSAIVYVAVSLSNSRIG